MSARGFANTRKKLTFYYVVKAGRRQHHTETDRVTNKRAKRLTFCPKLFFNFS